MIYTVTLNPALDKTVTVPDLRLDAVNRVTGLRSDAGGKGVNVSKVIAELGGSSTAVAVLAGRTGDWVEGALRDAGIETLACRVDGETRTNLKVIDPVGDTHTDINEPGPNVDDDRLIALLERLLDRVEKGDIVALSGSLPAGADQGCYGTWTRSLGKRGVKVYLDADGEALRHGLAAKPHFAKPNDHELSALVGQELSSVDEVAAAARELAAMGVEQVMVSMGGRGAVLATDGGCWFASPVKVPVGSTVGAGDSVVAAMAYAESEGMGVEDSLRLAMATGAANVMQSGTQAAERGLVDSLIEKVEVRAV